MGQLVGILELLHLNAAQLVDSVKGNYAQCPI